MIVLSRSKYGRPYCVELTDAEMEASLRFQQLLDEGKDCVEAAEEVSEIWEGLSEEFLEYLKN